MRIFIKLIIFIFSIQIFYSQKIFILDEKTKEPISQVLIYNLYKSKFLISDENGSVDLSNFSPKDSLFFQHTSYKILILNKKNFFKKSNVFLKKKNIKIDDFIIYGEKSKIKNLIFNKIDILKSNELSISNVENSANLLTKTGNIIVQKSQGGGGSPIIRGFEANKILMVIDGVRMNNAIYRSGHLQNSITIDNAILENTEIIYGSVAVIYGSDALGGVIHYQTKKPKINVKKISSYFQYSTMNTKISHINLNFGKKKFALLSSFTYKNFGDIKMGKNREFPNWGKSFHYVKQINNIDSTFINSNAEIQKNTSYKQMDFLQKILFSFTKKIDIIFNFQFSTSSNINRYDKLNEYKNDNLKYSLWYYTPQNRFLGNVKTLLKNKNFFYDNSIFILSYQKIKEGRVSRKFRNENSLFQKENLNIYGINIDMFKKFHKKDYLKYGFQFDYNEVFSEAYYENIFTKNKNFAQTRYPDGNSYTENYSFYSMYNYFFNEKIQAKAGVRFNYSSLESKFIDTNFVKLSFNKIYIDNFSITKSAGIIYSIKQNLKLNLIFSNGFRNPNVDDYGKIRAKYEKIIIPNGELKPEYTYNLEFGISKNFKKIKINAVFYKTFVKNGIFRTNYSINGNDSLNYDGDNYKIITNKNINKAEIKGFSLNCVANFSKFWKLNYTFNYTNGKNITQNLPMGHIPPIFGKISIIYRNKLFLYEINCFYNGEKNINDFSPFGEDNQTQATKNGYPSWKVYNLNIKYKISKNFVFSFSMENILDKHYKTFASAISETGRNFIFNLKYNL